MNSLISPDNTWALWTFIIVWAAVSIVLEQKYKWASKVTGAIIALLGAIILANIKIIPTASPVYDSVWNYVVPMAIPLLLMKADLRKIYRESGRMFGVFHISALGTCIGTFVSALVFSSLIPYVDRIAGMMTGSYIGGGVNFVAMTAAFGTPENITNATIVADNLVMAVYFFIGMTIPTIAFFRKNWGMLSDESAENEGSAGYWTKKEISLKDIAVNMAVAVSVACASSLIAGYFAEVIPTTNAFMKIINSMFGNMYLIMTTIMVIVATVFSKQLESINGGEEIGTFLIYLFFVVLGVPASIEEIIKNGVFILMFCILVVLINLAVTLGIGKIFRLKLDELLLASNACIGGPTTAVAMAIAKGWKTLIVPVMLSGIWGYILGNYAGIIVGNLLGTIL
ncbi:DUF819 domain-containing protein [Peptacetobacter hominis]|uniref:DUF819 domain-containing protein n=1 Tax=Peptacetobacter hominis TaxID=2743610 RepID=A0A544QWY9_9FIRM|nr:DUF819 family protein [Peptacetobacter hominis]TQQ85202.1 DUF819 domain-containing protein [Peptacetobacter hominis]